MPSLKAGSLRSGFSLAGPVELLLLHWIPIMPSLQMRIRSGASGWGMPGWSGNRIYSSTASSSSHVWFMSWGILFLFSSLFSRWFFNTMLINGIAIWFWCIWVSRYLMGMCFREKKNKSGMVSIQILDESCGSCRKSKTSASFSDPEEITCLHWQPIPSFRPWPTLIGQPSIDFRSESIKVFVSNLKRVKTSRF